MNKIKNISILCIIIFIIFGCVHTKNKEDSSYDQVLKFNISKECSELNTTYDSDLINVIQTENLKSHVLLINKIKENKITQTRINNHPKISMLKLININGYLKSNNIDVATTSGLIIRQSDGSEMYYKEKSKPLCFIGVACE